MSNRAKMRKCSTFRNISATTQNKIKCKNKNLKDKPEWKIKKSYFVSILGEEWFWVLIQESIYPWFLAMP